MGDEQIALGPSASGSDEGPEGVWGGKCFFGLVFVQLQKSAALGWSETVPIFSKADVMSVSGGLL